MASRRQTGPQRAAAGAPQSTRKQAKKDSRPGDMQTQARMSRPNRPRQRRGTAADPRPNRAGLALDSRRAQRKKRPTSLEIYKDPSKCHFAVQKLSKCNQIAVDCEGVLLSRTGRLCLLQMASKDCVYIFDLVGPDPSDLSWGKRFFEEGGLKALLESPHVSKVMHDCRHDSDALYHQYDVKLGPVIDTQVVFSVLRRVRGMEVGLPVSLKTLLKKFAGATEEELIIKNAIKNAMQDDGDFWLHRPLTSEAIQYVRLDVQYLLGVLHQLSTIIEENDKTAWDEVRKQSQHYLEVFRYDEDGPRKAQQQYEHMARIARRQRVAYDQSKRVKTYQQSDPMRKFTFDTSRVLQALAI